jgi:hypothetical protein
VPSRGYCGSAWLICCVELFGGLSLTFGMLTRAACVPLMVSMLVAIATAKRDKLSFVSQFGFEEFTYFVAFFLAVRRRTGRGLSSSAFALSPRPRGRHTLDRAAWCRSLVGAPLRPVFPAPGSVRIARRSQA